jgi:sensor domain CHASE-containing protein
MQTSMGSSRLRRILRNIDRLIWRWPSLLVIALLWSGGLTIGALMWTAADSQDDLAADQSIALLYNLLGERRTQLGQLARDYAWWDDAAVNLTLSPNLDWATSNIGPYLSNSFHVGTSLVLDPNDRQAMAFVQGVTAADHDIVGEFEGGLKRLAAEARKAPADAPVAATGFLLRNGEIQVAGASVIIPTKAELRDAYGSQKWAHVLVLTQPLDHEALQSLAARFGLRDLEFRSGPIGDQKSSLRLAGVDGRELGFLTWRAETPGFAILRSLALPVAIAFDLMVVLAVLIVRQIGRLNSENRRVLNELAAKNGRLEELTALQRATLDVIPDGIAVFDRDLCLLAWNQAFADLLAYPTELLQRGAPLVRLLRHDAQARSLAEAQASDSIADDLAAAARREPQPVRLVLTDGRVVELRRNSASDGRLVMNYRVMAEEVAQRSSQATARELWHVVERSAAGPSA